MRLTVDLADPGRFAERVEAVSTALWLALRDWLTPHLHAETLATLRGMVKSRLRGIRDDGRYRPPRDLTFRSWNDLERFEQELAGDSLAALPEPFARRPVLDLLTRELPAVIREALDVQVHRTNPGADRPVPAVPPAVRHATPWRHGRTAPVHGPESRGYPRPMSVV